MASPNSGCSGRVMPPSKMMHASAPRSSASRKSTTEWPPISSSPSDDDADVHGQRVLLAKQLGRLQEREELALVVGDPACVVPAVALVELERRRLPELERRGRLDVEVPVDHHRRRIAAAVRIRGDVADDELALSEPDELRLAAAALDEVAHPFRRAAHVVLCAGSALTLGIAMNSRSSSSQACSTGGESTWTWF